MGNIEWRTYYFRLDSEGRNTFRMNFPGAFFKKRIEELAPSELEAATGCDLAIGHPECGLYSQMQGCNNFRLGRSPEARSREEKLTDKGDIPLFLDLLARLRPRFFVMDDLPKSFLACPMEEYHRRLPDYDLFPEWISNWHYGNIQKKRVRMFMIGSLKSERWAFVPGEEDHEGTLSSLLCGLPVWPEAGVIVNHDPHTEDEPCGRGLHMDYPWHRPTYGDYRRWMEGKPEGTSFKYHSPHSPNGELKTKPGWYKQRWNGHCAVIDGGSGHTHPLRNLPFTIRERARIQGFPDDFVFYGTRINSAGEWNHEKNIDMLKQTGKAMPIQFCRYVSEQIAAHILGTRTVPSGRRFARPDRYIDEAKRWFCQEVGYADQERACDYCWMKETCEIRTGKYGLAPLGGGMNGGAIQLPVVELPDEGEAGVVDGHEADAEEEPTTVMDLAVTEKKARRVGPSRQPVPIPRVETRVVEFSRPDFPPSSPKIPTVNLMVGEIPSDYHCRCRFCTRYMGELRRRDGGRYSRTERKTYYDPIESSSRGRNGHAAKTPLHLARWAIQRYTRPTDWVLDPTAGAGTTLVEALVQGRHAAGMELQYEDIISANVTRHSVGQVCSIIGFGDARNLEDFLSSARVPRPTLVVNNPPYSGDESTIHVGGSKPPDWERPYEYDRSLPNLAFLREGEEYWRTIRSIYSQAADHLLPGGRFVIGVKDMMRNREYFMLHRMLCEVLERIGLEFEGTALLLHYPPTLHLNTYEKRHGVKPPIYQTINVFRKPTTQIKSVKSWRDKS